MHLEDLAEKAAEFRAEEAHIQHEVRVCVAASCQSSGSLPVLEALKTACGDGGGTCKVKGVGCMGLCSAGPLVAVADKDRELTDSVLYRDVTPADAAEIILEDETNDGVDLDALAEQNGYTLMRTADGAPPNTRSQARYIRFV